MKQEHNDKWLQQLKAQLAEHETTPDNTVWEAVEARLAISKPVAKPKKLRVFTIISGVAAAIVAILLMLPLFNNNYETQLKQSEQQSLAINNIQSNEQTPSQKESDAIDDESYPNTIKDKVDNNESYTTVVKDEQKGSSNNIATSDNRLVAQEKSKVQKRAKAKSEGAAIEDICNASNIDKNILALAKSDEADGVEEASLASAFSSNHSINHANVNNVQREQQISAAEQWAMNTPPTNDAHYIIRYKIDQRAKRLRNEVDQWSMRAYTGNIAYASTPLAPMALSNIFSISSSGESGKISWDKPTLMLRASYDDSTIELGDANFSHNRPFNIGLSFVRNIGYNFFAGSGMFYSIHRSDFSTSYRGYDLSGKQEIQYIGLPIELGYNLYQNSRLRLYAFTDGSIEFPLSRKVRLNANLSDIRLSNSEINRKEKLQFSIGAGAGAELRIMKFVGIYAEPEMHYYINNNSGVHTIYKDSPFNINFNLGVRFVLD